MFYRSAGSSRLFSASKNFKFYNNHILSKKYEQDYRFVRENLKCFFDISINNKPAGRLVFELFAKDLPRTSLNFYHLCVGDKIDKETNKKLHYKNTKFHRIIQAFMCQGGDVLNGNGTGSCSIFGKTFGDEKFVFSHDQSGLLSMANRGPNTNGSQFFITTNDCAWLDGKHVVFGKVLEGKEVLNAIEAQGTDAGKPKADVVISECGALEH